MADNAFAPKSPSFSRCISNPQELIDDLTTQPSKRSRGRPKGSKNKPKPPTVITVVPESYMEAIFIEIAAGEDVMESIIKTAWRHQADISVLRGFGVVSEITLLNSVSQNCPFTINGNLQMTSLSGTYVYPNSDSVPSEFITDPSYSSFTIYLSGNHGQVFGGVVAGKVRASSNVVITASLLRKPKFYRVRGNREDKRVDTRLGGVVARGQNNQNNVANVSNNGVAGSNSTYMNCVVNAPHAATHGPAHHRLY